jgi:hypothetical protein
MRCINCQHFKESGKPCKLDTERRPKIYSMDLICGSFKVVEGGGDPYAARMPDQNPG